jgi:hypothetical protein
VVFIGLAIGCDRAIQPTQSDVAAFQFDVESEGAFILTGDHPADSIQWDGQPQEEVPPDSVQWDGDPWDWNPQDEQDTAYHDPEPWIPDWPDTL